ncbi:LytR family transcriptional regulator [Actinomadura sp. LD22]|uniref:LytR family transcriptional regulator n=1 Tax=Actinomadura physcomitrii TaxID=2650748 RepID=A0A6I4MQU2_9ACTN|nr:LCP family protein [Actinomadura physcomitrii]MWA04636.1 LytR family transcriptional regulator [Actinomadura physcomitrii]
MSSPSPGRRVPEEDVDRSPDGAGGLPRALALTLASALVWGVAHLAAGRRVAGGLLLGLWVVVAATVAVTVTVYRSSLVHLAVRPDELQTLAAGIVVLGIVWIAVVIRSYLVLSPARRSISARTLGAAAVAVMCFAVAVPVAWGAHSTYVYRDALTSIFRTGSQNGRHIDTSDPWEGQPRVNILLLGGDAAADRTGVRTDSMTLASVDTKTGDTVLLSLPRNLEKFPMPPGPARDRFPYGFTGDGPENPGLLNEVYEYAENHPDVVPGVPKNRRGPELLKATIAGILGQRVDYYILVDMFGFADIVDAMGGVKIRVTQPIPYGLDGQVLQPGYRTLKGKEALWYGRSRTDSDDYVRMGRQKCLMRAIAQQADPQTVLTSFDKLAAAAKRTLSTDLPQELLPALIKLSGKVKDGAQISSLQFVPPLINSGNPDFALIRRLAAKAVGPEQAHASTSASPSPTGSSDLAANGSPGATPSAGASDGASPGAPPSPTGSPARESKPTSLAATCPS